MNARTTPDMQMPENNSLANRDLWHWCRLWEWEQYERPTTNNISLTSSDKKDLQKIAQRLTEYCQENLSKKFIKKASSLYEECHIEKSGNGYTGKPLVAPDEKTSQDITWQYIENMLSGFAAEYLKMGTTRQKSFISTHSVMQSTRDLPMVVEWVQIIITVIRPDRFISQPG